MKKRGYTFLTMVAVIAVIAILAAGSVLAAIQYKTLGGTAGYPANMVGKVVLLERTIDFSDSSHTGTAADVYQMLTIPAGSLVVAVGYEIEDNGTYTGEDGTCTIDIGDGSDPNGYFDGANVETSQTAYASTALGLGSAAYTVLTGQTYYAISHTAVTGGTYYAVTVSTVCTNVDVTTLTTNVLVATAIGSGTMTTNLLTLVTAVTPSYQSVTYTNTILNSYTHTGTNTVPLTGTIYPVSTAPRPYADGVFYSATDTLDMVLNNDADQLRITIRALVVPMAGM